MKNIFSNISIIILLFACQDYKIENAQETNYFVNGTPKSNNYLNHITNIRKNSRKCSIDGKPCKILYFVDYVILNLLEKPEYKKYITNRNFLRKLDNKICRSDYVMINDTLLNGGSCRIEIESQFFRPEHHELKFKDKKNYLMNIDGKFPYGAILKKGPFTEIKSLSIEINNIQINTDIEKYRNIYELNFCNFGNYDRIIEAYEDGDNIYIYLFGGKAANAYFAKLIFDKSGFVTSIVADYSCMSKYGNFGKHFVGF